MVAVYFSDEISVSLKGHVVYADAGIGFAMEFDQPSPEVIDQLKRLLDSREAR